MRGCSLTCAGEHKSKFAVLDGKGTVGVSVIRMAPGYPIQKTNQALSACCTFGPMREGTRLAVLLVALGGLLRTSHVRAEDPPLPIPARLEYLPAQGCPPESVLRAEFARRMGSDPFVDSAPLRVVATITRENNALTGSLALYDNDGKLIWSKPSTQPTWQCATLVREMAGALAFRLDPKIYGPDPIETQPPPEPAPVPTPALATAPFAPPVAPPPPPPKRALRFVAGLDAIFMPFIAPSASAGFALWAGLDLVNVPLSFELDLRSTWSVAPAHIPLAYQPLFAVRASYVSGVVAGCWRQMVLLCPVLEVGSMSYSRPGATGELVGTSTIFAAGGRVVYARPILEHLAVRGIFEVEGVLLPFSIADDAAEHKTAATPSPVSFTWGVGFGGSL
jgi:hypothetical protein